jgi:hypothetical protein
MTVPRLNLLKMRNISDKSVEKIKSHILCSIFIFSENRVVYEIIRKNKVERERPQITIQYCACTLYAG